MIQSEKIRNFLAPILEITQNYPMALDNIDRQLLALVQQNARTNMDRLAGEVGLSPAAVQRRLKRMRESGVIKAEVIIVDPIALGYHMTFVVAVEMERERTDILDAFRRRVLRETQVQQCYYVTGDSDFVLIVVAKDMDDYEAVSQRLFYEDANVRRCRTSVVVGRQSKISLTVPTETPGN